MNRAPRKEKTHTNDLTIPINPNTVMQADREIHKESCFSYLWDMQDSLCIMCADNEMCGIMFHKRQKKMVKAMEETMSATMDTAAFDDINKDELLLWLKSKPRRTGELVEKITQLSKCNEIDTVKYWVKSFVKEHPRLAVQNQIVVILPKS